MVVIMVKTKTLLNGLLVLLAIVLPLFTPFVAAGAVTSIGSRTGLFTDYEQNQAQWPVVQGKVVNIVRRGEDEVSISFEYRVAGLPRSGVQEWKGTKPPKGSDYGPGSQVAVYYNPERPETAVIDPKKSWFPPVPDRIQTLITLLSLFGAFTGALLVAIKLYQIVATNTLR